MKTEPNTQPFDLDNLVEGLQKEDNRNLRLTNRFKWLMWILTPIYFIFFIIMLFSGESILSQLGFLLITVSFLLFAFVFKNLNNEYRSVDYGIPTIEMLQKAIKRYTFWQTKTYKAIFPAIIACLGVSMVEEKIIPYPDQLIRIIIFFIVYSLTLSIAFFIGYLIWRKRQKPLLDHAQMLLDELEK
jgi:hypothetical protein